MLRGLLVALFAWAAFVVPATAQKKHAFAVGIDRYDNLPAHAQLRKAVGDARAMGETLAALGFEVTLVIEPTRGVLVARWYQFLEQVKPRDTIAFVFSGHGVELEGANFLLPRDVPRARTGREGQLRSESLSFGQLLTDMRERQPAFSFVVLDACRDNPFQDGGRSVGGRRGLGRVEALEGTFVMFSAGAGQIALDRLDDNDRSPTSIFTRTLLPLMRKPGLSLLDMADQVGEQVRELARMAGHEQTPAFYSRVIGGRRLCLAGCELSAVTEAVRVCREVAEISSLATLTALERQHQGTPVADCISARLEELKAAQTAAARAAADQAAARAEAERQRRALDVREAAAADAARKRTEGPSALPAGTAASGLPPAPVAEQPVVASPGAPPVADNEFARDLQAELKRLGCFDGAIDGLWGPKSRSGLEEFLRRAGITPSSDPSHDHLEAARRRKERVCPLLCKAGEALRNGECALPVVTAPPSAARNAPKTVTSEACSLWKECSSNRVDRRLNPFVVCGRKPPGC